METMEFMILDEFGHVLGMLQIPYEDLYWVKRTFLCHVGYRTIVLY